MSYELEIKKEKNFIHARASGIRTRQTVASLAAKILEACIQHKVDKVLVDVRGLDGRLSVFDSFLLVTREFPKIRAPRAITQAAIVDAEKRRERYRFFERVARNRGYNLRLFEDVDLAAQWLCGDDT